MTALLALVLLLQETPEQAFQKVEAAVENAKSLKVLFTLSAASEVNTINRGTFCVDANSKSKLSADLRQRDGSRVPLWSEFDGTRLRAGYDARQLDVKVAAATARSNFNMYLSRLGIVGGAMIELEFLGGSQQRSGQEMTIDLKQVFAVGKLVDLGEGRNGTRILNYEFVTDFKPCPFTWAKIWYDAKTYALRRRESRWGFRGHDETIIEEYEFQGDAAASASAGGAKGSATAPAPAPTEAEQDVLFIRARLQVADEHLKKGRKQKAIDVLEDVLLSFPKHPLAPDVQRRLDAAKKA